MGGSQRFLLHVGGLRGLAILMVVFFHLCPQWFSNGFYGVDVFFVISGYLLFYGWRDGVDFSFASFAKKKILRIYPSLCALILLAGISVVPFLYDRLAALSFGKNSLYSLLGFSNIYYIKAYSDYFAEDSNMNPLLHTWFLSVTIQMYLLWAVGATILRQATKRTQLIFLIFIASLSLVYSLSFSIQQIFIECFDYGWGQEAAVSYYDPLGRIWQVLAGGLVCILPAVKSKSAKSVLFMTGLLLLCSVALCNSPLQAWVSILVVAGTVLLLRYAEETPVRKLLENRPLMYLGRISFSLYLVHFPIVAFYRNWERVSPDLLSSAILLLFIILIAWGFWRCIESRKFSRSAGLILFSCAMLLACLARSVYKLGLEWNVRSIVYPAYNLSEEHTNYPESVYAGYDSNLLKENSGTLALMRSSGPVVPILSLSGMCAPPQFVLVGNSVAQELYAGFHTICKERKIPGVHLTTIVIPLWDVHVGLSESYNWTEEKAEAFISWLRHQRDLHTVVVSYLWKSKAVASDSTYLTWKGHRRQHSPETLYESTRKFCERVKAAGKQVVIITPTPVFSGFEESWQIWNGEDYVQLRKLKGESIVPQREDDPFVISKKKYMEFNDDVFEMLHLLESEGWCQLLHIEDGIFREGNFAGVHNGTLFCRDKTHITPPASIYIMQGVANQFEEIIKYNQSRYRYSDCGDKPEVEKYRNKE